MATTMKLIGSRGLRRGAFYIGPVMIALSSPRHLFHLDRRWWWAWNTFIAPCNGHAWDFRRRKSCSPTGWVLRAPLVRVQFGGPQPWRHGLGEPVEMTPIVLPDGAMRLGESVRQRGGRKSRRRWARVWEKL